MASAVFTKQDKKAFYSVHEEQMSGFSNCLGTCFKMKTREDKKDQLVWVLTSDMFKNSSKRIVAKRCMASKKEGDQLLITSEVHSQNGVSFIKYSGHEDENYLSFGYYDSLPHKISAYVFDEENILELKFEKISCSTEEYKQVDSSKTGSKGSRNFDLRKAVGAPVIKYNFKGARNQVVGILDVKTDRSLYPVFFNSETFDLESKSLLKETDDTDDKSDNSITASVDTGCGDQIEETNDTGKSGSSNTSASGTESGDLSQNENKTDSSNGISGDHSKNGDKTDSSNGISDLAKHGPIAQETEKPKKDKKPSLDDNLEKLWENPFFQDELCKALDLVHSSDSELKDHRHVAHVFDIPPDIQKQIAAVCKVSPSEKMFEHLRSTRPDLTIKEFCEKLEMAKAYKPRRSIRSAVEGKVLQNEDLVSQLAYKDLNLKKNLILQLDAGMFWQALAKQFNIPEEKCSTFLRDPDCDPTRKFFLILKTQSPELKVSKFKTYLEDLDEGNEMLMKLSEISGERDLRCLNSEAALMCDVIEPMLNSPKSTLLYRLAEKFQKAGYLRGINIDDFKTTESYESPTAKLMEYILTSMEKIYKIKDLKDCLVKIERNDCVNILMKYVEAGAETQNQPGETIGDTTDSPIAVSGGAATQNQPGETSGDTIDSPIAVSAEAVTQNQPGETSGDTIDSPIAVSAGAVTQNQSRETSGDRVSVEATTQHQPGVASGATTSSQIVFSGHIHQHGQGTNSTTASSNLTPIFQDHCIKNKPISQAPPKLFIDLEILLDPPRPLGGDYRTLSDKFGHSNAELNYFETRDSPTNAILRQHEYKCKFQTLRNFLTNMERDDAVDVIDNYIRENCECEQCGNLR